MNLASEKISRGRRPKAVVRTFVFVLGVSVGLHGLQTSARAHDVRLPLSALHGNAKRVYLTLTYLRSRPIQLETRHSAESHRRALGAAGIEKAMNNDKRAIQILMARLEDESFRTLPEYVDGLLMASELLERHDENIGSMIYAAEALGRGGQAEQMAEAGARWFRGARRAEVVNERMATYRLWSKRSKENASDGAAGLDHAAMYEVAYALKRNGEYAQAQRILSRIPSDSPYGSRSAYLVGVSFIEKGDLANAERWFEAVMKWPIPAYVYTDVARRMETKVRELAALATGRLRYERGELEKAAQAYRSIPANSELYGEACYEQTFLNIERKRQRGAIQSLECAKELGVGGRRHVDVILMRASLLAHLGQYTDSVESYEQIEEQLLRLQKIAEATVANIDDPMGFLFASMERNATDHGDEATPGPPLFFGDLWSKNLDQIHRLYGSVRNARTTARNFTEAIAVIEKRLEGGEVFPDLEIRRQHFRILLRDIQHLQGHAADMTMSLRHHHGEGANDGVVKQHSRDLDYSRDLESRLSTWAGITEQELSKLDQQETKTLAGIRRNLRTLKTRNLRMTSEIDELVRQATLTGKKIASAALSQMLKRFQSGVMRARVGVLDTYWVRKEHVSHAIKALTSKKEELNQAYDAALNSMSDENP
jgi:tetratricopeptide (TPR) repeat protein